MDRRTFLTGLGAAAAAAHLGCRPRGGALAPAGVGRPAIGIQLYALRDDARIDLERTLERIARIGYREIELLGSFDNFGMPPVRLRQALDANGLRAPSTHVAGTALDDLERQLDEALTLGHSDITVASLPIRGARTLDDYRRWADRLSEAGTRTVRDGVYVRFHNHANDHTPIDGVVPYDLFIERTDPSVVRMQLDTGNTAMAGHDPLEYLRRYGHRYGSFHIKDVPRLAATSDVELGTGIIDFPALFAGIHRIGEKHLFVEQETYPGTPMESAQRNYTYVSGLLAQATPGA